MDTDFLLIRKMKQGDEEAMEFFVRKYYLDILQYCKYHCFNREYAEDLTQETFIKFFGNLSVYHYSGKTKNFLYTIARNLCRDYYKKIKEIPMEEIPESEEKKEKNKIEQIQNKLLVEWALKRLPEEFREVVILYYFHDIKLKSIAGILQIGLPLVKYRMKRAKELLEQILREEEVR